MKVTLKLDPQTVTCLWSIITPRNSWAYQHQLNMRE